MRVLFVTAPTMQLFVQLSGGGTHGHALLNQQLAYRVLQLTYLAHVKLGGMRECIQFGQQWRSKHHGFPGLFPVKMFPHRELITQQHHAEG